MSVDVTFSRAAAEYLDAVKAGLDDLDEDDREAILRELEAHLGELAGQDPSEMLGEPEAFVAEFRQSAGLEPRSAPGRVRQLVVVGHRWLRRLSEHPVSAPFHRHRAELRTVWVWTRGWILLSAIWWLDGNWVGRQLTFGVPGVSPGFGVVMVGGATAGSLWLAGRRNDRHWGRVDRIATAGTVLLVGLAWLNPVWIDSPYDDSGLYPSDQSWTNIYAYDRSGEPVEVLLYDQDGRPIEVSPSLDALGYGPDNDDVDVFYDQWGPLRYETDRYGRPVTNLYPLQRLTEQWNPTSERPVYEQAAPPRVGIPEFPEQINQQHSPGVGPGSESPVTTPPTIDLAE
jgi:hypothetical protein